LPSYVRQTGRIVRGHVGEHQPFLVVVFAQDLVLAQVETVAHAKPADTRRALSKYANDVTERGDKLFLQGDFIQHVTSPPHDRKHFSTLFFENVQLLFIGFSVKDVFIFADVQNNNKNTVIVLFSIRMPKIHRKPSRN